MPINWILGHKPQHMDEMRENMRRANLIEDLVHRIDSPFTASISDHPLPPKFKMPSLDS